MDREHRASGEIHLVYFSSPSNNTHRFIQKLGYANTRIPFAQDETVHIAQDYVLISPTYSGGGEHTAGAVPKQVIKFLNDPSNRSYCRGVIATGNTNFGNTYGLAGQVLSNKLGVPLLYTLEIAGTIDDVTRTQKILEEFWGRE